MVPVAVTYGTAPGSMLHHFFDLEVWTPDLKNLFRAIMGLYLAMIAIWIMGIARPSYWRFATIVAVFFMSGLAFGRGLSLVLDGPSSPKFMIGMGLEIVLAVWGWINLRNDQRGKFRKAGEK